MANNNDFVMGASQSDKTSTFDRDDSFRSDRRDTGGQAWSSGLNIRETARARPVVAAAAVTAVAAAGAYLWSKRSSSQPLMQWGQQGSSAPGYDSSTAASQFDTQAQSSFDSAYAPEVEIASSNTGSNAGMGVGGGSTGGSMIDSDLGSLGAKVGAGTGQIDGPSSNVGSQISDKGDTGLDDVSKTDTKTGSIAYGA